MISPDKKANLFLKGAIASALLLGSMSGCEDAARPSADATKPATPATTPKTVPDTQNPPSTQVAGIPPLIASPQTVDFGIVEPGSELSADITLLNTSSKPVRILRAQPSCTCTTVNMDNVVVPPKGTVQMPISMTTNRAVGRKVARVQLLVEGYPKFFTVNLDAENAWAVRAIPPHLSLKERADQPEKLSGQFVLESVDKRTFKVLNVMDGEPQFIGFDPKTDEPRNSYQLRYDFTGVPCTEIPPFLIVRTDHPGAAMLDVRVRHDPCTKIQKVMPMTDFRSNLGVVRPGQRVELPVGFKKPRRPTMASVSCNDPNLDVRIIDQTSDGKELLVTVMIEVSPEMPDGLFQIPLIYSDGTISDEHMVYGWMER